MNKTEAQEPGRDTALLAYGDVRNMPYRRKREANGEMETGIRSWSDESAVRIFMGALAPQGYYLSSRRAPSNAT